MIIVDRKNENKLKNDVERMFICWLLLLLGHPQHLAIIQRRIELQATYKATVYKKKLSKFNTDIFLNTTGDIPKLLYVISRAVRRVKFEAILKYHEWFDLC